MSLRAAFPAAGQLPGTATNDNAAAGNVGEFVTANVTQGVAVNLSTGTPANVTSISLTAGDWDVHGIVAYIPGASTVVTSATAGVNSTSQTTQSAATGGGVSQYGSGITPGANAFTIPFARTRFSLSATTTIFLVASAAFTTSSLGAFGIITARRVR